ncbi:hypothetical protein E2C01_092620 [Portunus trituberculatus]|uniref:Uncharacterized protein n=1 Tax=Portunus trituberculatus TaxID=210409 RepID=A0A5B7JR12_PORTR|nr:hypothetical protein [Portunus trituberculatus]
MSRGGERNRAALDWDLPRRPSSTTAPTPSPAVPPPSRQVSEAYFCRQVSTGGGGARGGGGRGRLGVAGRSWGESVTRRRLRPVTASIA